MNLTDIHERWEAKRDDQICSLLEGEPTVDAVDLGCGTGEFTVRLQRSLGCREITGVDVWDEGLSASRKRGIRTVKSNLDERLPFRSESFDVVLSNQVIEHLWFQTAFLEEILRILRPGGYAVVSTENLSSWENIGALMLGFTPFSMQLDEHRSMGNPIAPHEKETIKGFPPHTRILTYTGLCSLLDHVGFLIEDVRGSGYLPFGRLSDIDPRHARFITAKVRKPTR